MEKHYIYFDEKYERNAERIIFVDGVCPDALTEVDLELSHWLPNNTPIQFKRYFDGNMLLILRQGCGTSLWSSHK